MSKILLLTLFSLAYAINCISQSYVKIKFIGVIVDHPSPSIIISTNNNYQLSKEEQFFHQLIFKLSEKYYKKVITGIYEIVQSLNIDSNSNNKEIIKWGYGIEIHKKNKTDTFNLNEKLTRQFFIYFKDKLQKMQAGHRLIDAVDDCIKQSN